MKRYREQLSRFKQPFNSHMDHPVAWITRYFPLEANRKNLLSYYCVAAGGFSLTTYAIQLMVAPDTCWFSIRCW
jgi:hypothetical protein